LEHQRTLKLTMTPIHEGEQIDQYLIHELVARGGMASIFRATDMRTGRQVALKVPHPEAECDIAYYERFQREAQIGRELDHPGVVKIFEAGKSGSVYLAMEWVEGRLLREILAEGRLAPDRALRIARALCDAVDYIHAQGIIHRDLKPENIMIRSSDEIKLLDFGIAGKAGARRLTFGKLSNVMGTAEYIAPEQVKGKRGDARSDVYALGTILYEMLTGKTPFSGANPFAVMNARLKSAAEPVRLLNPNLSSGLEYSLGRALERDPRKRYQSAHEFAQDLEKPGRVAVAGRPQPDARAPRPILFYSALAAIPVTILLLMLLVAHNQ
jgi:serine/threonine protein kinase